MLPSSCESLRRNMRPSTPSFVHGFQGSTGSSLQPNLPFEDLELPTFLADKRILSFLLPPFGALFSMSPDTLLMGQIRKRKKKFRPNFVVLD